MLELLNHQGRGNKTTQFYIYGIMHWVGFIFSCKQPSRQRLKGVRTWNMHGNMHYIQCVDTNAFDVGNSPTRLNENPMCIMDRYN